MASVLLRGNAIAEIVLDNRGDPIELNPLPWENVSVQLLPNRRLVYDVVDVTYLSGGNGRSRRLLQDEVFHLRDRSDDGLIGKSRLTRGARPSFRQGYSFRTSRENLFQRHQPERRVLKSKARLTPEQKQQLARSVQKRIQRHAQCGAARSF